MSAKNSPSLPVPEFIDQNLCHSFKHQNGNDSYRQTKRPPKLYPKYHDNSLNKSCNASIAQAISFHETTNPSSKTLESSVYNADSIESYFEQSFEVLCKLGEGSFGEVFKVRSKEDGQLYAVKKSKKFYRSGVDRQKQLEEVRMYEQLSQYKHCITLYKAWEQDYQLYMQFELCQGSLDEFVVKYKNGLSEYMVWNIFLDILLALKALHDNNLLHLDIKLDNVLINEDNECKLGDFGLVIDLNTAKLHEAIEGDSRYVAPELLHGRFSKAADIFSLGIAILELACNLELPKNGPLWQELRSGVLPNECIALLSTDLYQIIKSMMDPNPIYRPDVNSLLRTPIIQQLLRRRQKLTIFRRMKIHQRKLRRSIWQKLCNFRNQLVHVIRLIFSCHIFTAKKESPLELTSNSSENSILLHEDSENEDSSSSSPKNNIFSDRSVNVVNSTPVSACGNFRRIRRPYGFDLNTEEGHTQTEDNLSFTAKRLLFNSEDDDPE